MHGKYISEKIILKTSRVPGEVVLVRIYSALINSENVIPFWKSLQILRHSWFDGKHGPFVCSIFNKMARGFYHQHAFSILHPREH